MKGMYFDNVHSFEHLNLVLSNVDIPPAEVKTNYIDIPGGDGSVDLTEALGEVKFKDRECAFTFTVFPHEDFEEKKKYISNILNGTRCKMILDKDPKYYWEGRCFINEYASDRNLHQIVVKAIVAPYKLKVAETVVTLQAGQSVRAVLVNGRKTTVPTITNSHDVTIVFEGNTYTLNPGTHQVPDIELKFGDNPITITSEGSLKFTYQEGDL